MRDVVDAYVRMMEQFPDGGVFNIASGKGQRLADLLETIQEISGVRFNITKAEALLRKNDIAMSVGDSTAFSQSYGWRPAHSIRETLEWILAE